MNILELAAGCALELVVALLAVLLARRRSYHRPAAALLVLLGVADTVRLILSVTALAAPGPYVGATRLAYNLDQALFLAEPLAVGWSILAVLHPAARVLRGRYLAVAVFTVAAICVAYPQVRGHRYQHACLGVALGTQGVGWAATAVWARRHPHAWPSPTATLTLIYLAAGALRVVQYAAPDMVAAWSSGWQATTLLQLTAIVIQALWVRYDAPAISRGPDDDRGGGPGAPRDASR